MRLARSLFWVAPFLTRRVAHEEGTLCRESYSVIWSCKWYPQRCSPRCQGRKSGPLSARPGRDSGVRRLGAGLAHLRRSQRRFGGFGGHIRNQGTTRTVGRARGSPLLTSGCGSRRLSAKLGPSVYFGEPTSSSRSSTTFFRVSTISKVNRTMPLS